MKTQHPQDTPGHPHGPLGQPQEAPKNKTNEATYQDVEQRPQIQLGEIGI